MEYAKTVDGYIEKHEKWRNQLIHLRKLLASTTLKEEIKWGAPAYTHNGKLIAGIAAFKNYFGIWFFQGVFLKDSQDKLVNAQEGKTKAMRQWRFQEGDSIDEELVLLYIEEAIQNCIDGKEVKVQRKVGVTIPPFLKMTLKNNTQLAEAFKSLTPGKRREYAEYIAEAKREETRQSRLQKIIPMILNGRGLHDKYKNC
jgi:uncharacterized protein YdeI (YjbR/CyaY-like superfamily)